MSFGQRLKFSLLEKLQRRPGTAQETKAQNMDHAGFPSHHHSAVIPRIKGVPKLLGLVGDDRFNRDSCGSVRFGNRTFWTWRDTQVVDRNGKVQVLPVIASTASWTDNETTGSPVFERLRPGDDPLRTITLRQYGNNRLEGSYFPILDYGCDPRAGMREDGSRRAIWPDSPPLVTTISEDGRFTAYTWVRKVHIWPNLTVVTQNPATTLYRICYKSSESKDALPEVSVVDCEFWKENEIPFGAYGNIIKDGIAYLYGQANGMTAVARVPVGCVEQKTQYEFWVDGQWTRIQPSIDDRGAGIPNANVEGQGTYYYSEPWQSFVWIGGSIFPCADMYITTAPTPTGPWIQPFKFYSGINGKHALPAYSIQAHPSLLRDASENAMYITYTKSDVGPNNETIYTTPLVYVEWENSD